MHRDKWIDTIGLIKDRFDVVNENDTKEEIGEDVDGKTVFERIEYIEFNGPLGKMKLELSTRPIVVEKKTNYSRRFGSDTDVKYVFSNSENTSRFSAYKFDENTEEWEEISGDMFEN